MVIVRITKDMVVLFTLVEISETYMVMKKRARILYIRTQFCKKIRERDYCIFLCLYKEIDCTYKNSGK